MENRRRDRSENPWMAGDLYLQSVAGHHGLDQLALATREGLLLSASGDRELGNRLAAVAPVFAEEPAVLKPGMLEEMAQGQPLQLWRVTIRERPFYLIGFGAPTDMPVEVQRWPIRSSPLGALIDPARDFTKFSKVVQTGDPSTLSVEARDPKRPEFGTITLVFQRQQGAPAGLSLYGWVARDAQGNRTAVRLSAQQYNAPVADSAFRWKDPRPQGPRAGG